MQLTSEQVKGRIKNLAKQNGADARILMRVYMMERFLERVANSGYQDNFIIKGGMLVTAMVGVALRSTMDIDTSIKNQNLSMADAKRIIDEIKDIDLGDGVVFEIMEVSNIMDGMEYPGIRFSMNAMMGRLITPMKIDISTGDVITPRAIEYRYKLLLEDRYISLWSYNLETILAEKLQTILARGILNTRMRDFYDIKILFGLYEKDVNTDVLRKAFQATCENRGTEYLKDKGSDILSVVSDDEQLQTHWKAYQRKYTYAADLNFCDVVQSVKLLWNKMQKQNLAKMKTLNVVAAVIADNMDNPTKIFATARGYGAFKGGWEFPGGKIEPGETPAQALKREIREELDTEIRVGELLDRIEYDYPDFHLSMDCFWCEVEQGDLTLKEHEAARWLTRETIDSVNWLPADITLMRKIRNMI